jgi:HEAT repeat protein
MFKRRPKDPSEQVAAALAVLRQQHEENNTRGIGLMNMPKHQQAKRGLVNIGSEAVPALLDALNAPRANTDTPQGQVDDGVANDIADVLGAIGDPRAVGPLMAQFRNYIVSSQSALAAFPQGVEALLHGLDDHDEFIRSCCIQGLGLAKVDRARVAQGIAKAFADPHPENRREAALAAWRLGVPDPELITGLRRLITEDPSERVRGKATDALRQLSRP